MGKVTVVAPDEDPYMAQYDKGVALIGYGLLLVSPFMVGLPAMASVALGFAHRQDSHPLTRSHYRFQSRIFWIAIALLILALALVIVGGGLELTSVAGFIAAHVGGPPLPHWLISGYRDDGQQVAANGMMAGGVVAAVVAIGWLMLASLWGALKLVLGRPIGERR